jgi:uncharacterized coiled-coil DUF342 family protein
MLIVHYNKNIMELKEFKTLEEKIIKLMERYNSLKKERDELINGLREKDENIRVLNEKIDMLKNEREEIYKKVESLLARLEDINFQ